MKRIDFPRLLDQQSEAYAAAIWVGALSFERRCLASLEQLRSLGIKLSSGVVLEYQTDLKPSREGETRRRENRKALAELAPDVFYEPPRFVELDAYVFEQLTDALDEAVKQSGRHVVLDVTCMTKIHALAAASYFEFAQHRPMLTIVYSIPENYGFIEDSLETESAWRDLIIAPLAETARLFNESSSRGIIIPGHESHRLIVAMGEIEPTGGLIVIPSFAARPDLRHLMLRRNQRLFQQLTRLASRSWRRAEINIESLDGLADAVAQVVEEASAKDAPVIVFPFGPKPVIFAVATALCRYYPRSSWFAYPIPVNYDVSYSFGIEKVLAFQIDDSE